MEEELQHFIRILKFVWETIYIDTLFGLSCAGNNIFTTASAARQAVVNKQQLSLGSGSGFRCLKI